MKVEISKLLGIEKVDVVFKNLWGDELCRWDLGSYTWCSNKFDAILYNVFVYESGTENIISKWEFSLNDFDLLEKYLYYFCKLNPNSLGLVIGAHDGSSGHWVKPMIDGISSVILVEPSDLQYDKLLKNYTQGNYSNLKDFIVKEIITNDGRDVEWFEGGEGHTNTINKEVISKFLKDDEITTYNKSTMTIDNLLKNLGFIKETTNYPNWVHLDTEGSDADLILSLEWEPNLIIFEAEHLDSEKKTQMMNWFKVKNYDVIYHGIDGIALKNKK